MSQHQTSRRGRFDQALEAIPAGLWNLAELSRGIEMKIDNNEREVAISQKQIGCFHRFGRFGATHPQQLTQTFMLNRLGIERILPINESDKITVVSGGSNQRVDQ